MPACIEEGLADGDEPPGKDDHVEREERRQHGWCHGPCGDARRGLGGPHGSRDGHDDERRDEEEGGEPAPSVERLTETGNDGRQAGGEQPAAVDGSGRGCGPDPGGVHDGRDPL